MASEQNILDNIARRVRERLQGEGLRSWPVSLQRQAMELAGIPITTRRMVDVWEDDAREKTLMTREQRDAEAAAGYQRLLNLEAAPKLAARITDEQIAFIARRIAECQKQARR